MQITRVIQEMGREALQSVFGIDVAAGDLLINETKPEFEGDYTIVLFPFVKQLRQSPDAIGKALGDWLLQHRSGQVSAFQAVKGFLNLSLAEDLWIHAAREASHENFGVSPATGQRVMVEYSSPNTNKPLHLGHLRNIFLGWSVAEIFKATGSEVMKSCIVNDRGVHICKSMLAWQMFGNGATPASTGQKGDHFVGDYYVKFENALRAESAPLLEKLLAGESIETLTDEQNQKAALLAGKLSGAGLPGDKAAEIRDELKDLAREATSLMHQVRDMLRRWEQGDEATLALWRQMNGWVYEGFDATYRRIGADFQKIYYESDTYLLGRKYVDEGLASGVFYRKDDGSVWIDLTAEGLDEKLVLRKDGTSVYITQDIGLAKHKYEDFPMDLSIYVIADEQNYHMKVLQLICRRLAMPFADGIHHLSYGMVDLPSGRMKSREGTVVDADDICDEMEKVAAGKTAELGKVDDFTEEELKRLYHVLGMGALKFYLLRVDPRKRMVFNPEESIDFHGFTGPFVQYTYARIRSVLRKVGYVAGSEGASWQEALPLLEAERALLKSAEQYPAMVQQAAQEMNPSVLANYVYHLAKTFNSFYAAHSIANAEAPAKRELRLQLSHITAEIIRKAMGLLGIEVPERM